MQVHIVRQSLCYRNPHKALGRSKEKQKIIVYFTVTYSDCNRDTTRMIFILFEGTIDVIVFTIDERNKLLGGFHVRLIGKHYN